MENEVERVSPRIGLCRKRSYAGTAIFAMSRLSGWSAEPEKPLTKSLSNWGIPYASTDWEQALRDLHPDIIAVGTPGRFSL